MIEVYPARVKSLVYERTNPALSKKYIEQSWLLDIAGPFCFVDGRDRHQNSTITKMVYRLSDILCLNASSYRGEDNEWNLVVQIEKEELDRLIRREYIRQVSCT